MSGWLRPRNIFIAGGVGAALFLFPRTSAKHNPIGNVFETQGVKNIGDRYSAGGGSDTHIPGVATKRGDANNTTTTQQKPTGVDTPHFQDTINDQKPAGDQGVVNAAYRKAHYGSNNEKGK